jgi:hypothetical protein
MFHLQFDPVLSFGTDSLNVIVNAIVASQIRIYHWATGNAGQLIRGRYDYLHLILTLRLLLLKRNSSVVPLERAEPMVVIQWRMGMKWISFLFQMVKVIRAKLVSNLIGFRDCWFLL